MRLRRSLFAVGAALALTAGAVFGHEMPEAATDGLATAMAAAQKLLPMSDVPDVVVEDPTDETGDETTDETGDETDLVEPASHEDGDEHCLDWSGGVPVDEGDDPNHGAYVCGAAQAEWQGDFAQMFGFEDEFRNLGEFVSWVARGGFLDDETTDDTDTDDTEDTDLEQADQEDGDNHCLDWSEGVPVDEGDEPNHGAYVCGAAHADWQAGGFAETLGLEDVDFRNRGTFMRWVAQRGYEDVDADASVASADQDKGNHGKGKGKANGHGKGRGRSGR